MTPLIPMLKRDWIEFRKHVIFTILFWVLIPILIHTFLAIPLSRLISMDIRYLNWSAAGVWISSSGMTAFFESANRLRKIHFETRQIDAILHEGNIKMDGTLERLIESTHGLTHYRLAFSKEPPLEFMEQLEQYPRVLRPRLKGFELEFYSRERQQFFKVLRLALDHDLADLDTSICRLRDLFIGLTEGGLE